MVLLNDATRQEENTARHDQECITKAHEPLQKESQTHTRYRKEQQGHNMSVDFKGSRQIVPTTGCQHW